MKAWSFELNGHAFIVYRSAFLLSHMNPTDILLLSLLILLAAALSSSVGHGGASGYLAAMALFGLAPAVMRPTALCLNLIVASLGTYRFWRAGHFRSSEEH